MPAPSLLGSSVVRMRPLAVRREGARAVVGWKEAGVFLEADATSLRAIELLQEGRTVDDAARQLLEETGEEQDVAGAVQVLAAKGLVAEIDGLPVPAPAGLLLLQEPDPRGLRWLHGTPYALLVLVAAATAALLLVRTPTLLLTPRDAVLVTGHPLTSFPVLLGVSLAIALAHEWGHWATARSFGIASRVRFAYRQFVPVLSTDVSRAWILPRSQRITIFLAGMGINILLLATILAAHHQWFRGDDGALLVLVRTAVFVNLVHIAYQFLIFLRTDVYFALTTAVGAWNLHNESTQWLDDASVGLARRLRGAPPPSSGQDAGNRPQALVAYGLLLMTGTLLSIGASVWFLSDVLTGLGPLTLARATAAVAERDAATVADAAVYAAYLALLVVGMARFLFVRLGSTLWRWSRRALTDAAA